MFAGFGIICRSRGCSWPGIRKNLLEPLHQTGMALDMYVFNMRINGTRENPAVVDGLPYSDACAGRE